MGFSSLFSHERKKIREAKDLKEREEKEREEKERNEYLRNLYFGDSSQESRAVTGKRKPNQTLHPDPRSSHSSLNDADTTSQRTSQEERDLPMPRKTPGGLPQDPVVLGGPVTASGQKNVVASGHDFASPQQDSGLSSGFGGAFGAMNAAADVAVITSGFPDGGAGGF